MLNTEVIVATIAEEPPVSLPSFEACSTPPFDTAWTEKKENNNRQMLPVIERTSQDFFPSRNQQ